MSPATIRSPAVARSDELLTYFTGKRHCSFPVSGSNALMCGGTSGFGVRPSRRFGPGTIRLHISADEVYHHPMRGLYAEWLKLRAPAVPGHVSWFALFLSGMNGSSGLPRASSPRVQLTVPAYG